MRIFEKVKIGQELKINARYENLKRESGDGFQYVARKDDVVIVRRKVNSGYVVSFFEDTVMLNRRNKEVYGEFVVEPINVQKFG